MICVASSKHRSIRFARMWNSKSPGVETAWRVPARISRNSCSSAGRGNPKEPVPRVGPKAHDAGEATFQIAKINCAQESGEVPAQRPHGRSIVQARVYCCHQENRGAGERRSYWLGNGPRVASGFGSSHRFGLHLDINVWTACAFAIVACVRHRPSVVIRGQLLLCVALGLITQL